MFVTLFKFNYYSVIVYSDAFLEDQKMQDNCKHKIKILKELLKKLDE